MKAGMQRALFAVAMIVVCALALWLSPLPTRLGSATPHQDRARVHEFAPTTILMPRCTGVVAHLEGQDAIRGEIHVWDDGIAHGCRVAFWRPAIECSIAKREGDADAPARAALIDGQVILPEATAGDVYPFTCQLGASSP